jgi:uroporphyrin-III C-methyltransferase/precorrin-2 dehydrogenase/sirohydrochlorin ferrochelatase
MALMEAALETAGGRQGAVAVICTAGGPADLLTLRAAARLEEADAVFHDHAETPGLDLARRDAIRVGTAREPALVDRIFAEAAQGRAVVWLTDMAALPQPLEQDLERRARIAGVDLEVLLAAGGLARQTPLATAAGRASGL